MPKPVDLSVLGLRRTDYLTRARRLSSLDHDHAQAGPLARFGHDRDGKTGCPIIVYGALTDADGRPVAVQVYPGNTGDPTTVPD